MDKKYLVPNNVVFWVGSGISKNDPSNLPLGVEFSNFYVEKCLEFDSVDLLQRYREVFNLICNYYKDSYGFFHEFNSFTPRLELVFNIIRELQQNAEINILDSLSFMGETYPNCIHKMLALLVKSGCSVITPNFDLLIETSIEESTDSSLENSCPNLHKVVFENKLIDINKRILHYHGIFTDINSLGISLNDIVLNDNSSLVEFINRSFGMKSTFVMLGFSFSDDLDVLPIFKNDILLKNDSKLVFVQHHEKNSQKRDLEAYKKDALQKVFGDRFTIEFIDTISFLKNNFDFEKLDFNHTGNINFDWKNSAEKKIEKLQLHEIELMKLMFSYEFGIVLDYDASIIKKNYYKNDYVKKKIKNLSSDFQKRFLSNVTIEELCECFNEIAKRSEINEGLFNDLNRLSWSLYRHFIDSIKGNLNDMQSLLTITEKVLKLEKDLSNAVVGNYKVPIVVKRNLLMLGEFAYEYGNYQEEYIDILQDYMLTNNVDGVISSILDVLILDRYFCRKYNNMLNTNLFELALELVKQSKNQKHIIILKFVEQI